MRVFISTGEASGEFQGAELAAALRRIAGPGLGFSGIGADRMRGLGFDVWFDTRGWASMGPLQALGKIPRLLIVMLLTALRLVRDPVDVVVLVDFGAFNLRLARQLRRMGYRKPIVYYIPPGAWLDRAEQARLVAGAARPLTIFAHQADFYRELGLPIDYFGHPLPALVPQRPARVAAPLDEGCIALLPGSRRGELQRHVPVLIAAARIVRAARPRARFVLGVANAEAQSIVLELLRDAGDLEMTLAQGARAALDVADAVWVASGTAVLEAALSGVPAALLYVLSPAQWRIGKRVFRGRWIGLPNLVLNANVVPELLQEAATPSALAEVMESLLRDPQAQLKRLHPLRAALGPPDALERCARFVLDAAG